ncbi:MAG TPA: hypothetical protein PK176_02705 [Acidobacteriota bacterium]|nr:hypothetical protein [Acidobacteriota bacterium]HQM62198.1 hypothetical protein [Acidobacteriota bacterium]
MDAPLRPQEQTGAVIACRNMTEADLPAAVRIINESYHDFPIRTAFSAWGLGHTLVPQYGLDLARSFIAEADGEIAGVLLLAIDGDARESFVFGWNVPPRFHRLRVGFELEKCFTRQHLELGVRISWAFVAHFRRAHRYRAVRFRETRSLYCLDVPAPSPAANSGIEVRPCTLAELEPHYRADPPAEPAPWIQRWRQIARCGPLPAWRMALAWQGTDVVGWGIWRAELFLTVVQALRFREPAAGRALLVAAGGPNKRPLHLPYVPAGEPLYAMLQELGATTALEYREIRRDFPVA